MSAQSKLLVVAAVLAAVAVVLALTQEPEGGSNSTPSHHSETAAPPPPRAPPPQGSPDLIHTERRLMGTTWDVGVLSSDSARARAASAQALDEVARLESVLSEWQESSQIAEVNRNAGVRPVRAGPELFACVQTSLDVARWSDGAFDISWAALRDLWDFSAGSRREPPTLPDVSARLPLWDWRAIDVAPAAQTVFLRRAGMQIGLGGIAKGYALDRAGAILREAGFPNFLIFGGGQVLVGGTRGDRPWRVGIQHPRANDYFAFVQVSDASVATSGDYEHFYVYEGRRYHHILDHQTGFPSERSRSVTVVARTALAADAVDTAVFVMGPERGLAALENAPLGPFEAVIVGPDLRLHVSPSLGGRLALRYSLDPAGRLLAPIEAGADHGSTDGR